MQGMEWAMAAACDLISHSDAEMSAEGNDPQVPGGFNPCNARGGVMPSKAVKLLQGRLCSAGRETQVGGCL